MTFTIPVQCSTNWAIKPSGSWSHWKLIIIIPVDGEEYSQVNKWKIIYFTCRERYEDLIDHWDDQSRLRIFLCSSNIWSFIYTNVCLILKCDLHDSISPSSNLVKRIFNFYALFQGYWQPTCGHKIHPWKWSGKLELYMIIWECCKFCLPCFTSDCIIWRIFY